MKIMTDEWGDTDEAPQYMLDARMRSYWINDLRHCESLGWMNSIVSNLWPYLNEASKE
jgi:hypothetical protein